MTGRINCEAFRIALEKVKAKQEFLNAGMNDFVAKPIELKVICQKLRQWLPKEKIEKHRDRTKE